MWLHTVKEAMQGFCERSQSGARGRLGDRAVRKVFPIGEVMFEAKLKPANHAGQGQTCGAGTAEMFRYWSHTEMVHHTECIVRRLGCGQHM